MKVKVLKLGEAAKEVEVQDGATLQHVIQALGFNREHMTVTLNGHPAFDTSPVQDGDVLTLNPHIKGGKFDMGAGNRSNQIPCPEAQCTDRGYTIIR